MFQINKLTLPATILIASIIFGSFYGAVQIIKWWSIEKQKVFSNELKCQTLLKDLKKRWNNVVGIYYSYGQNTCIVKYTKDGETEEAPIEKMQDIILSPLHINPPPNVNLP